MVCPLLTTIVLGRLNLEGLAALGGSRDVLEELANPLRQGIGRGAISDNGDIGLRVGDVGVAGNVLLVQVLLVGRRQRRVYGGAETSVEGNRVGVVEGESGNVGIDSRLLEVKDPLDVLVELVSCSRFSSTRLLPCDGEPHLCTSS